MIVEPEPRAAASRKSQAALRQAQGRQVASRIMAKTPPKPKPPIPVESFKHKDARVNIPTEELRDFVAEAEARPGAALYPRDPSLGPQLVWKGKDQQDLERRPA